MPPTLAARFSRTLAVATALCASSFAQTPDFAVGTTVLASPVQLQSAWKRCLVQKLPQGYSGYILECADEFQGSRGKAVRTLRSYAVPAKWVKADDPAFHPNLQVEAVRAELANPATAKTAAADPSPKPAAVALGSYECWAFNRARMLLNFTVTAPGRYTASGDSKSTFEFDAATGTMRFSGYLKESLPNGYKTLYHQPKGIPTVSFRSAGGDEVSFCEKH